MRFQPPRALAIQLVNIGSNRWSFKPEIAFSKALGPWTLELTPGFTLYTDNGDFFDGKTREVVPLYAARRPFF
jgi:hypothetical protein